jgi:hypothetical protein
MSDRDRLARILREAARPARRKPRAIICYDSAWAGLPRITVYDPPSRRKAGWRKRARRAVPACVSVCSRLEQRQLELAL